MNRIFKVIKSKRTGSDIAVSELASSKGGVRRLSAALILASGLCTSSVMAEGNDANSSVASINENYGVIVNADKEGKNGVSSDDNLTIEKNEGTISGEVFSTTNSSEKANGIIGNNIKIEKNTGIISGKTENKSTTDNDESLFVGHSANGIYGKEITVTNNIGVISGVADLSTENGSENAWQANRIRPMHNANGIYGDNISLGENSGVISGELTATSRGVRAGTLDTGISDTSAKGSQANANGIIGNGSIKIIENSGVISGYTNLRAAGQSSGFYKSGNAEVWIINTANGIVGNELLTVSGSEPKNYNIVLSKNNGTISGFSISTGGKLYYTNSTTPLNGDAHVISRNSANGIIGEGYLTHQTGTWTWGEKTSDLDVSINGKNKGKIDGRTILTGGYSHNTSKVEAINSANGISGKNVTVNSNDGLMSGYVNLTGSLQNNTSDISKTKTEPTNSTNSGNGVYSSEKVNVTNTGLIKGSSYSNTTPTDTTKSNINEASGYAVYGQSGNVTNYGILAAGYDGGNVDQVVNSGVTTKNYGLNVFIDKDGTITAKANDTANQNSGYTKIINIADVNGSHSLNGNLEKTIINGVGTATGALTVNKTGTIKNSIVNGYNTALTVNNGSELTATDTVFNGGGSGKPIYSKTEKDANGNPLVVGIEDSANTIEVTKGTLTINGASVINGNTAVSNASTLTLGNHIQLNGNLSGDETGTLNLGDGSTGWSTKTGSLKAYGGSSGHENDASSGNLKIYQNISGFKKMNINGQVTTYETAKISKVDNIDINENSQLIVRVNPLMNGEYTGTTNNHALYNTDGKVTAANGSKLIFKTNGMKTGDIIDMYSTNISELTDDQIDTWSILTTAKKYHPKIEREMPDGTRQSYNEKEDIILEDADFWEIFDPDPNMIIPAVPGSGCVGGEPWCPIYESIENGNQLDVLDPTGNADDSVENRKEGLLSMLDQIYANNPYNHSSMLAFKNVTALRWQIFETKMPKLDEWIASAHVDYTKAQQTKDRDFVLGDTSLSNKYQTDLSNYSALVTAEHGYKQDKSIGFAFGATHSEAKLSHNSKLDGNSFYLGIYNKHKVNNFEFLLGSGFSFGTYDGTRTISNQYQSVTNNGKVQTATFDFYGQAKYRYALNDSTFLEPKIRLSEVIIRQSEVNEDPNALAIDQDYKMYHVPTMSIGMDLSKQFALSNSVLKTKVGVVGERTFGHWDNLIGTRIQNSTDFVIQGAQFQRSSVNLTAGLEHHFNSTLFYKLGVNYAIAEREKNSLNVNLSVGSSF